MNLYMEAAGECSITAPGKLQAVTRAIPLTPLFFRKLQHALKCDLDQSGKDYSQHLTVTEEERDELQWWIDNIAAWNCKMFVTENMMSWNRSGVQKRL